MLGSFKGLEERSMDSSALEEDHVVCFRTRRSGRGQRTTALHEDEREYRHKAQGQKSRWEEARFQSNRLDCKVVSQRRKKPVGIRTAQARRIKADGLRFMYALLFMQFSSIHLIGYHIMSIRVDAAKK